MAGTPVAAPELRAAAGSREQAVPSARSYLKVAVCLRWLSWLLCFVAAGLLETGCAVAAPRPPSQRSLPQRSIVKPRAPTLPEPGAAGPQCAPCSLQHERAARAAGEQGRSQRHSSCKGAELAAQHAHGTSQRHEQSAHRTATCAAPASGWALCSCLPAHIVPPPLRAHLGVRNPAG